MVIAADRGCDRRSAGLGQDHDWSRRGESEGTRSDLPRSAACDEGRRAQDAGQLRFRRGRRRGDWLAAFRPGRAQAGGRAGALEVRGNFHAVRQPGSQRHGHGYARGQGRDRGGVDLERREVGPRSAQGYPFLQQGARRQPGLASGPGLEHARDSGWQRARDRRPDEKRAPAHCRRKNR